MKSGEAPKIQIASNTRNVVRRPNESKEKSDQTKDAKAAKRTRRLRWPIYFWAVSLSLLWLGSSAAFVYGAYGNNSEFLLTLDPLLLGTLAALILLPVGFIWVGTAALLWVISFNETALRLATISRELIDPKTTAANDVAKLGATIRKELDGLNREVDGAVSRVGMLEARIKEQTTQIADTADKVETQTSEITAKLTEERERVEAITATLAEEGRNIVETFDAQALAIDSSAEDATRALKDAESALSTRTKGLSAAAQEAASTTESIAQDIERETGKLETVSANARSRSEAITARFDEQHKLMTEAVDKQAEQQTRLDATMDQHQRLIAKTAEAVGEQIAKMSETVTKQTARVADRVAEQVKAIETSVGEQSGKIGTEVTTQVAAVEGALAGFNVKLANLAEEHLRALETAVAGHTDELTSKLSSEAGSIEKLLTDANDRFTETVETARARAVEAGEGFASQATAMKEATASASADLDRAVETIKRLAAEANSSLEDQVKTADALFGEQAHRARELLRQHADEMAAALESSVNDVREQLVGSAKQGNEALLDRAGDLDDALRRSEQRMRALYHRLDESIDGILLGTESVGKRLAETADAFEARMAQFPAHAEDAANKVHEKINSQIENLARIADSAADHAQVLIETRKEPAASEPASEKPAPKEEAAKKETVKPDAKDTKQDTAVPEVASEEAQDATEDSGPEAEPDLPGRDIYPMAWDGVDRTGPRRPRFGRPVLGPFDDLARSLADRFRAGRSNGAEKPDAATPDQKTAPETKSADANSAKDAKAKTAPKGAGAGTKGGDLTRPAPVPPKTALPKLEERGWKDILASVDRQEEERAQTLRRRFGDGDDADFERNALLIIEKLQAMSIDIDRALEKTPPNDLLDRYMSGERNVFARRLATFTGPDMLAKIARKHREDAEFRRDVTRYIDSFEELLKAARGRDRENILLETYLTSQTGKVYMILGTAIGHLKQNGD